MGGWGRVPGCCSRTPRGAHVSWENDLGPSPDAELVPRESVLPPVGRKCCERAAGPGPGVLSTACNAGGMGA